MAVKELPNGKFVVVKKTPRGERASARQYATREKAQAAMKNNMASSERAKSAVAKTTPKTKAATEPSKQPSKSVAKQGARAGKPASQRTKADLKASGRPPLGKAAPTNGQRVMGAARALGRVGRAAGPVGIAANVLSPTAANSGEDQLLAQARKEGPVPVGTTDRPAMGARVSGAKNTPRANPAARNRSASSGGQVAANARAAAQRAPTPRSKPTPTPMGKPQSSGPRNTPRANPRTNEIGARRATGMATPKPSPRQSAPATTATNTSRKMAAASTPTPKAKPSSSSGSGTIRQQFNNAFAAARKAGKDEFTFRGKQYNTKTA